MFCSARTRLLRREPGEAGLGSFGLGLLLFFMHELTHVPGANFPRLAIDDGRAAAFDFNCGFVFIGAKLAFDKDVIALGERFDRLSKLAPRDNAVPFGALLPFVGALRLAYGSYLGCVAAKRIIVSDEARADWTASVKSVGSTAPRSTGLAVDGRCAPHIVVARTVFGKGLVYAGGHSSYQKTICRHTL